MLAAATLTAACNKESEYHQTYISHPEEGAILVSGEGGLDSLCFLTTESFTLSTSVNSPSDNFAWYTYPEAYSDFTNKAANTLYSFAVPITFERNTSDHQRSVVFHIHAGDYSVECIFVQDTIHTATPPSQDTDINENP